VHYDLITESEPLSYEEVVSDERWWKAMKEEIEVIKKNHTWEFTKLPPGKRPITLKWVYKTKVNLQGVVTRHKARLVAKGFLQQAGVDYGEVFALVARIETIRLVVSLAINFHWSLH